MRTLERIAALLADAVMVVGGVALVLMMTQVTLDVAGKYFLNAPLPVTLEVVSNYYMVAVVFLPLAAVERRNGHIHVELLYSLLPRVARGLLDLLACGLGIFFFGLMTRAAWTVALRKFHVGEFIMGSHHVVIWPSRFLVPLGAGLITVILVLKFLRGAVALVRPDLAPDEASSGSHLDVTG
ncbi:TRAP-type C4-dicarboxylate transport system, small permease component [Tistlia consotensis]|uniref:TRAP transporter small permease protein n=1 Tax=Tistlia consotensis USBA 355 TaxID=560819 RepID=A0A1Y6C152_9PROT|nr:TRAP transporter small permease subunit [Tistlia consotensis]SMF30106.1 TRAP-type C4-dicarboxylate transport system, small permease component [Tistlia consotensis USBA 355]SNR90457.1 TRAP-type C4-dicarboxylate transport system, small permease component [Tistlia consotensis]